LCDRGKRVEEQVNAKDYQEALAAELEASRYRLCADEVVDKYSAIPRELLAPLFEKVININFNLPQSSWETAYLILASAWHPLMIHRNELHNAANRTGAGSEESLSEFRNLIDTKEEAIFHRLNELLTRKGA
jgi:hypothetical protein